MEWVIVLIVVVLLFFGGAKKIPEFAQNLGRARGEYERGKIEVEKEIASERAKNAQQAGLTAAAPAGPTWTCAKCGSQQATDAAFCSKCGTAKPTAS
jgi:TatA/E family protein of Tat protein translocase